MPMLRSAAGPSCSEGRGNVVQQEKEGALKPGGDAEAPGVRAVQGKRPVCGARAGERSSATSQRQNSGGGQGSGQGLRGRLTAGKLSVRYCNGDV